MERIAAGGYNTPAAQLQKSRFQSISGSCTQQGSRKPPPVQILGSERETTVETTPSGPQPEFKRRKGWHHKFQHVG